MVRLLLVALIVIVGCSEGPVGPVGPVGPKGKEGDSSVYQQVDVINIQDVAGCRYDTEKHIWKIESYYSNIKKNIDSCIVQVFLRRDSTYYWFEPEWSYANSYLKNWNIIIADETGKYAGYEGKIVAIGK